jgi:thioredoxin reductase
MPETYDALIAGGGPAGLSAALVLGRCRRRVLVCDGGRPRNAASHAMHCYLTREGTAPAEFLRLARADVARYQSIEVREEEIAEIARTPDGFTARLAGGARVAARRVVLATGIVDELPAVKGLKELYGRSVHHCPFCDGWEHRDTRLAALGKGEKGAGLAVMLSLWSRDVLLFSDGPPELAAEDRARLDRLGIDIVETSLGALEGEDGKLGHVRLADGRAVARDALFFNTGQQQRSPLFEQLGCEVGRKGGIEADSVTEESSVPGVYIAGDASRDVLFVIVAAAEGAQAACALNKSLMREDGLVP